MDLLDPATLNLVASLLIVLVMARAVSDKWRFDLWWFGLYALLACAAAVGLLLVAARGFEPKVFLFGVVTVAGLYWTGATRPSHRLSPHGHGLAAGAAVALAVILALVSAFYRWWIAPLTLLLLMATGLTINGVVPVLASLGWLGAKAKAKEARRRADEEANEARPSLPAAAQPSIQASMPPSKPGARPGSGSPGVRPPGGTKSPGPAPAQPTTPGIARAPTKPTPPPASKGPSGGPGGPEAPLVAVVCPKCSLRGRVRMEKAGANLRCPRCQATVPAPGSLQRTGTS